MSYTLKGRLQSRLGAAILPLLVACALAAALPAWWPLLLAALMLGVGLALDLAAYDRLRYQPGWLGLPFGLLELGLVMALVRALGIQAPLAAALGFFAGAWLLQQALAHAGFPLLALSYAEDGGELGRGGAAALGLTVVALGSAGGVFWAKLPPTVRLPAGEHEGPLVLDRPQTLIGEPGAIVRGGIVIRSKHVIVRDVTVIGGENGIEVENARHVTLERVRVRGASHDGIRVRRGQVKIRDCAVVSPNDGYAQGIDISFSLDKGMSLVQGCVVRGGDGGIVTHSAAVVIRDNDVQGTALRGIDMTEMSMGEIRGNRVRSALGVGIFCGDYSHCEIERNHVSGTRPDDASGDRTRLGYAIVAHFGAKAELRRNDVSLNPRGTGSFIGASIETKR